MRKITKIILLNVLLATVASADQWDAPSDYYNTATGNGVTLKNQLAAIMTKNHIQRNYGDFRYASAIIDRDPANSSNIILCYNDASVRAAWDSGSTWNREHVWPDSYQIGEVSNSTKGNQGDHHAIRPCEPSINGSRGNKPFGGATLTGGHRANGSYYFPGDNDKGDIARCLFYSAVRYGNELTLINGSSPAVGQMGDLASLLRWHYMDVPDTFERRRNHTTFSKDYNPSYYTANRSAFVDHPEFVWSIFGGNDNDTMIYVGDSHNNDGSSAITIDLGTVVAGEPVSFGTSNVIIRKTGGDGTYYSVTCSENISCSLPQYNNAFDYGTQSVTVNMNITSLSAQPGSYHETIIIDNLDVCGNSPAGCGSRDNNDIITLTYRVITPLEADLDNNGRVDIDDLTIFAANWQAHGDLAGLKDNTLTATAEIIDMNDWAVIARQWLIGCEE